MIEEQGLMLPTREDARVISRRVLLRGMVGGTIGAAFTAANGTATAQEATPAARTLLGEASFPAGTVAEGFVESFVNILELEAGASSPYPAADLTAPPLMGVVLLLVTAGQLVITPAGGTVAATPVSATPLAESMTVAAGEFAALVFAPATAYIVQNTGSDPARFMEAIVFNHWPTGGVPAAFRVVNWQGPVRRRVTAQTTTAIHVFQQQLGPEEEVPAPAGDIVQLVVSDAELSVGMRRDGSARNTAGEALDVYIVHFAYGSPATPTA
jgi:hypothetical protein